MKNNIENKKDLELWNSREINFHLCSKYPQVLSLVDLLLDKLVKHIKQRDNLQRLHTKKIRASLSLVVLNLYSLYQSNPKKYLAYSRNPGGYKRTRYKQHDIGYDIFIKKIVDSLEELGYIESNLGFYDKEFRIGMNSRMRANLSLTELFNEHKLVPIMVQRDTTEEVIILKDISILEDDRKKKSRVDYEDTEQTNQMRNNLHIINALLDSRWVDLNVSDKMFRSIAKELKIKDKDGVDFTRKKLVRTFNNSSFEDGGRFYHGWWQDMPKQYRKYITIDGKETTEKDYSSIHFRILYAEQGIDIGDDDPYIVEGYEDRREKIKVVLNIILNAETKDKAIAAIHKKKELDIDKSSALEIYKKLEDRHHKIKQYFGSGRGVKLQYIDAQIAERVMLNLAKEGIVCLPIHDSFIVRVSHKIDLYKEMDKAFKDIAGVEARIDSKDTVVDSNVHREKSERLYGNKGHKFYDEEDNLIGVAVSGADINPKELSKLEDEYSGYHLREGQWIEHKGYI